MEYRIRRITAIGLLIAVEVVLSRFLSIATPFVKIGFSFIPIVVIALLYGPYWAGFSAAASDLLGAMLFPIGAYFFGFTVTSFLTGAVFGLFLFGKPYKFINGLLASLTVCGALNFVLDTIWLYIMMGKGVYAFLPARAFKVVVMCVVQTLSIGLIFKLCEPIIRKTIDQKKRSLRSASREYFKTNASKRAEISTAVAEQVVSLPEFAAAKTVFCYIGTEREIATDAIISALHADGKCVCVPRCDGAESMSARELHIGDELVTGRFGLIEPLESAPIVPPEKIDLAIVPSVACGRDFNRIGNGGGYYDRYLASCTAFKLALCPDALLARTRPCGAHDIKMDVIVTECETLKNKNAARKPL